jgi:hypothetical protein
MRERDAHPLDGGFSPPFPPPCTGRREGKVLTSLRYSIAHFPSLPSSLPMPKKTNNKKSKKTKIEAALYLVPTSRPFPIFRVRDAKVRGRASCAREWGSCTCKKLRAQHSNPNKNELFLRRFFSYWGICSTNANADADADVRRKEFHF